ncbi:MAG: helicase, partial [Acidobacteriota bacterium]
TQLWALKHEAPDVKGLDTLLHLAASGRTSVPVEKETPKALYRVAGYRIAGERAVRVDILERLADLIRPAIAWRAGSSLPKPPGAIDGYGFTVTGAMTSLIGAAGEDFASVLRALGYRMEKRPKPVEAAPSETSASEATAAGSAVPAMAPGDAAAGEAPVPEMTPDAFAPKVEEDTSVAAPLADAEIVAVPGPEAGAEVSTPEPAQNNAEQSVASEREAPPPPVLTGKPEEPELIEVWRPVGGSDNKPRHHHRPRRQSRAMSGSEASKQASGTPETAELTPQQGDAPGAPSHQRPERPDRQARRDRHDHQQRRDRQNQQADRKTDQNHEERPRRRRDRGDQVERAERERYYAKPHGGHQDRRDKAPDPNSPFAKLAALKQQLEANAKE